MTNSFRKEFTIWRTSKCCHLACKRKADIYYQIGKGHVALCNNCAEHIALGILRDVASNAIGDAAAQTNHVNGFTNGIYQHTVQHRKCDPTL